MKKVLISGTSRGIGLALVRKFLDEDYFVIGTTRTGNLNLILDENFCEIPLDVTSDNSIKQVTSFLKANFNEIDVLINNAGVGLDLHDEEPNIDIIKATFETNVFGLINFTESIKEFIMNKGTIFNISSIMGVLNRDKKVSNATAYRMSKAALNMYTKTLSARLESRAIKVVSIHPGWVKTDMGGVEADITPEFCANGIFELYTNDVSTNSFWTAETQTQLNW